MVSVAPDWIGAESPSTNAMTVLVAEPDADSLVAISEELTRRGFAVIPVTSWPAAAEVVRAPGHGVHIGVVDGGLADLGTLVRYRSGAGTSADRSRQGQEIPLIFTVGDAHAFDWESYAFLDSADYVLGPVPAVDLGQRVSALALRMRREAEVSLQADQLRAAVRRVSAAIQATNEPATMAAELVSGVGDVFSVSQVSFTTFSDDRVAPLSLQRRPGDAAPSPLDLGLQLAAVLELATRLWRAGGGPDAAEHDRTQSGYPELAGWEVGNGAVASLAVPVGDSAAPFGLLWMSTGGETRHWSPIEVSLLRHLAGVAAQALMQGRIISGQQEVLKRLQRLDDAKSNFLRTVNHELRTPLTSLTAYLDLIRDGAGGEIPASALGMLTIVERNAQRLGMLVDDVLTISRMTADPEVDWKPVNLPQLVSGVMRTLGDAAAARSIRVDVQDTATDLVVEGDASRLRQVFRNVADNAIKFTPAGGRVEVRITRCTLPGSVAAVNVVVADTGDGIAEEDMAELFTSFFRGANAEADAVAGSGLGLAIVRGVVDAHGGTIEVTDTVGGGTTVSVRLPVHHQSAA